MAKVDLLKTTTVHPVKHMQDGKMDHYVGPNGDSPTNPIVNRGESNAKRKGSSY